MRRKTTWWRNLGGLLAACVLAVLVAAPVSSAICLCGDNGVERITGAVHAAPTVQADDGGNDSPCKAACCLGGHCHHAGPVIGAAVASVAEPTRFVSEHTSASPRVLASRLPAALDRPPRA
jgi:hypothetical protein